MPSAIVSDPIVVQLVPSADVDAVTVDPLRARRTQSGATAVSEPEFDRLVAPALFRRWKALPLPAETSTNACARRSDWPQNDARRRAPNDGDLHRRGWRHEDLVLTREVRAGDPQLALRQCNARLTCATWLRDSVLN